MITLDSRSRTLKTKYSLAFSLPKSLLGIETAEELHKHIYLAIAIYQNPY
ncbi:hypothetical protein [Nostoc sp.]